MVEWASTENPPRPVSRALRVDGLQGCTLFPALHLHGVALSTLVSLDCLVFDEALRVGPPPAAWVFWSRFSGNGQSNFVRTQSLLCLSRQRLNSFPALDPQGVCSLTLVSLDCLVYDEALRVGPPPAAWVFWSRFSGNGQSNFVRTQS
jgi:hypothetical protein